MCQCHNPEYLTPQARPNLLMVVNQTMEFICSCYKIRVGPLLLYGRICMLQRLTTVYVYYTPISKVNKNPPNQGRGETDRTNFVLYLFSFPFPFSMAIDSELYLSLPALSCGPNKRQIHVSTLARGAACQRLTFKH